MKHKMSKLLSVLLCCVMLLTLLPVTAAAVDGDALTQSGTVSGSKTATNLDSNFESKVTLSLPSAEEPLVTDVVFVLDKSTSSDLQHEALKMLSDLKTQVEKSNAKVNVGVVIFNKVANNVLPLTDLDTGYEAIEAAIKTKISSGTNTHAGLLAGKEMLDNDTSVDASRKYLIFVSDGKSYMYGAEPTVTAYYWMNDGSPYFSFDNYAWEFKYQNNNAAPDSWTAWLSEIGAIIDAETDENKAIEIEYNGEAAQNLLKYRTKGTDEFEKRNNIPAELATAADALTAYATNVDRALYYSDQVYAAAQLEGYHCYAMTTTTTSSYAWASSFMDYLAGGETVSFAGIKEDILYYVGADSTVTDFMGYVKDDYNFDFVAVAAKLTMTVGKETLTAVEIEKGTKYGFGPMENGGYRYVLTYSPANDDTEKFEWKMNVPVTIDKPVTLTYSVKLMNPKTAAGTYGQYDRDGSQRYTGLYTNNSAVLKPVDSNRNPGRDYTFLKPTVSYTVATPTPRPSTSKPSTSKPISSPKTFDAGIALYGAMALLSLTGGAWVVNKKRSDK